MKTYPWSYSEYLTHQLLMNYPVSVILKKIGVLTTYQGQKLQNFPIVRMDNYLKGRRISQIRDGHSHETNHKKVDNYSYGK